MLMQYDEFSNGTERLKIMEKIDIKMNNIKRYNEYFYQDKKPLTIKFKVYTTGNEPYVSPKIPNNLS